jgi:hypothetical protein
MAKKSKVAMLLADEWRTRIEVGKLITRLQRNANDELDKEMTAGQLKSAELLLRKALPDLSAVTVSGDKDAPITVMTWLPPS